MDFDWFFQGTKKIASTEQPLIGRSLLDRTARLDLTRGL